MDNNERGQWPYHIEGIMAEKGLPGTGRIPHEIVSDSVPSHSSFSSDSSDCSRVSIF